MVLTIEEVKVNPALIDMFIKENRGLIINVIKKNFTSALNRDGLEDIIQEGYLALYKAIDKFDSSKGFKFSTYAVNYITGSIKNYYRSGFDYTGLNVTAVMRIDWRKYNYLNSRGFTDEEIAKKLDKSLSEILELKSYMKAVTSLDGLITEDESDADVYDVISSEYDLEEECDISLEILEKANIIKKYLSVKHYKAIMLKLNDSTHKEIAKKLGIGLQKVRMLFNEIKDSFQFITDYYEGTMTETELIKELKNINGKSENMQKKMKYDDVVKAIVEWAIAHPGESITRKCIDTSVICDNFNDAKMNAIQLLRSEGYVVQQTGVTFRLMENVLEHEDEEIDHHKKYQETLRTIDIKDLSDFMTDLVAGMSASHDKLVNMLSQFREPKNKEPLITIKDKEITSSSVKNITNTIETIIKLAEANGKKVQATILIDEIN